METARVFIIHSERDNKVLKKLVYEFHQQTFGNTTLQIRFVDSQKASQLGRNFGDIIEEEIDNSKFVIVIITVNSQQSVWVNQEIGYTWKAKKNILPMKEKSMAKMGLGFLHSNIDAQLFHIRQRRFHKLVRFFEGKLGPKSEKVVKKPLAVNPTKEEVKVPTRRIE